MITKKKLCAIKGLSEVKVEKMKEAVLKICGSSECRVLHRAAAQCQQEERLQVVHGIHGA